MTVSYLRRCMPLGRRIIKDKRIILAGPQTTFRAGVARVLSLEHDMQIVAQCEEHTEIRVAVETLKPSALIVSTATRISVCCSRDAQAIGPDCFATDTLRPSR